MLLIPWNLRKARTHLGRSLHAFVPDLYAQGGNRRATGDGACSSA